MIVDVNSWHYKMAKEWVGDLDYPSNNLCGYFWEVVAGILKTISIAIAFSFIMLSLGFIVVSPLVALFNMFFGFLDAESGVYEAVHMATVFILIAGPYFVVDWLGKRASSLPASFNRKRVPKETPKKPNLLFEYLKAKKQKICPIIEFKNTREN